MRIEREWWQGRKGHALSLRYANDTPTIGQQYTQTYEKTYPPTHAVVVVM